MTDFALPREYDDIFEAVESQLEACGCDDLVDRLSQERYEERNRHELLMKRLRREAIEECRVVARDHACDSRCKDEGLGAMCQYSIMDDIGSLAYDKP